MMPGRWPRWRWRRAGVAAVVCCGAGFRGGAGDLDDCGKAALGYSDQIVDPGQAVHGL